MENNVNVYQQENAYTAVYSENRVLYRREYKQPRAVSVHKDESHSHNEEGR